MLDQFWDKTGKPNGNTKRKGGNQKGSRLINYSEDEIDTKTTE